MIFGIFLLAQPGVNSSDAYAGEHYQKGSRPCIAERYWAIVTNTGLAAGLSGLILRQTGA
jgi:hypothetical protein